MSACSTSPVHDQLTVAPGKGNAKPFSEVTTVQTASGLVWPDTLFMNKAAIATTNIRDKLIKLKVFHSHLSTTQFHVELVHDLAPSLSHSHHAHLPSFSWGGLHMVRLPILFPLHSSCRAAVLCSIVRRPGAATHPLRRLKWMGGTISRRRCNLGHDPMDGTRQHLSILQGVRSLEQPLACCGDCLARLDRQKPDELLGT